MHWKFSRPALLFLLTSFTFGMGAAQLYLYLNFYLVALEVPPHLQGLINALPSLAFIVTALPGAVLSSRIGLTRTLQLGGLLTFLGLLGIALSTSTLSIALSVLLEGAGAALIGVASAPFMTRHSNDNTRVSLFSLQLALITGAGFLGNLLGGLIPQFYADAVGVPVQSVAAVRVALLCGAVFQLLSLIPTLFMVSARGEKPLTRHSRLEQPGKVLVFILPTLLLGLGAGLTIPYINLFIEGKFGVSYSSLGALFAWTSLTTAAAALIQPKLVQKFGEVRTVLLVQGASLPFLAILGFSPSLLLVSSSLFIRGALANAASPVYSAYTMRQLSEADRGIFAALSPMAWSGAFALSNLLSGWIRSRLPFSSAFDLLFTLTLLFYVASVGTLFWALERGKFGQKRVEEQTL